MAAMGYRIIRAEPARHNTARGCHMNKKKLEEKYPALCIAIIAIICIILTGAGSGQGALEKGTEYLSNKVNIAERAKDSRNEIDIHRLIAGQSILRINYDLNGRDRADWSTLDGYTGEKQLLGAKLDETVILDTGDVNNLEWFPVLEFDAYDWFDEEKGMGTISLVLTRDSELVFTQMIDTTLYEQLPEYSAEGLQSTDSRSVQQAQLNADYELQKSIKGLKKTIKLEEPVNILRNIEVIIPESM